MAAIAVGADCVFLPERPPPLDQAKYGKNWEQEMCDIVQKVGNFFYLFPHLIESYFGK